MKFAATSSASSATPADIHTASGAADRKIRSRLGRVLSDVHTLSIADQAVASGTNFLATVSVAHWSGPAEVGVYAVGLSLLVILFAVQESLILLPYSIHQRHTVDRQAEHAGAALALSSLLSGASFVALAAVAFVLFAGSSSAELAPTLLIIAGIIPFVLAREFCRRYGFAHLLVGEALALDTTVAVLQLGGLSWLGWAGHMSAQSALICLGMTCCVSSAVWFYRARSAFAFRMSAFRTTLEQSWVLGRWLLVSRVTVQIQGYFTYWLSMAVAGATVTGVYAACMSIVALANPVVMGLGNILSPKAVRVWGTEGGSGLMRQAVRDTVLLGMVMLVFCVAVSAFGQDLMHYLYRGPEFHGYGALLTVLAIGMLVMSLGMPAANALVTMEKPRAVVTITVVVAVITVGLVLLLLEEWGLIGAACGLLAGAIIGTVGRWMAFAALVPRSGDLQSVHSVVANFAKGTDERNWTVTRLGEGDDAVVYSVESKDGRPIWDGYGNVVVKLYKTETPLIVEELNAQFQSLLRLHRAMDGQTINEWKVCVPRPLQICESPPALVMTKVPGAGIDAFGLKDNHQSSCSIQDAAYVFAEAMNQAWSRREYHGDLGFRNLLFDKQSRTISFIDAGTKHSCHACSAAADQAHVAARDLAHLLCELATEVMDLMSKANADIQRQTFFESALHVTLAKCGSRREQEKLLEEIGNSAKAHLHRIRPAAWSVRGCWHWLVYRLATVRIQSLLDQARRELDARDVATTATVPGNSSATRICG